MALEVGKFAKGFVAALVELEQSSIQPKSPEHLRALNEVHRFIAKQVELARDKQPRNWFKDVVRLRNSLSPGQTGAFDQFETALRDLQLSFTESPNPNYEDIIFTVSKPFASSSLEAFEPRERDLIRKAAGVFVDTQRRHPA